MISKRKVAGAKAKEDGDPPEPSGPDYSSQVHRVLTALRVRSPLSKSDLGSVLGETPDDFDFSALWDILKKSIHTRYDENTDKLYFEHELLNVRGQNLKEFIDKKRSGVSREELVEFNKELTAPINELLRTAAVLPFLGWKDSNRKTLMLFPRGTDFRVPLSGTISAKNDSRFLETSVDLRQEIRRGDAIVVEGAVYRVSTEESGMGDLSIKELRDQIANEGGDCGDIQERDILESRMHALVNEKVGLSRKVTKKVTTEGLDLLEKHNEFSSSSTSDPPVPSKGAIRYKYDFDASRLPIDKPFKGAVDSVVAYKFGCTNDIREVYWKVAENPSNNFTVRESDRLDMKLLEANLISDELMEGLNQNSVERRELHAKRLAQANSAKNGKKQRRSNFPRKVTNVHMLEKDGN